MHVSQSTQKQESQHTFGTKHILKEQEGNESAHYFTDNRPEATAQRKMQAMMDNSPQVQQLKAFQRIADKQQGQFSHLKPAQKNNTGLPDDLKTGIENLSGFSMDDVQVHYNSDKPTQLQAYAYAQGTDIHIAPGQERHLPHEAWHVVQQKQGRVKPTMQMKGKIPVNDDSGLEKEADVMGSKAQNLTGYTGLQLKKKAIQSQTSVHQLFTAPPANPPAAGVRGRNLNAAGVPTESHVTTIHGAANDLAGTAPGAIINGWNFIQNAGATGSWVRFHLINQQIGGLGDQNNLVPTSQATNHNPVWRAFEIRCQTLANASTGIHVSVDVVYPAAAPAAVLGTLAANQHFYPNNISAQVHYWDPHTNAYVLDANQPNFAPFPLQPPAAVGVADLTQQTNGWVQNTLMGGTLTAGQALTLNEGLQDNYAAGDSVDTFRQQSNEPTPEMQLLDAIDTFIAVELQLNVRVPVAAQIQILNGAYTLP
ncbi:MAG: DUF4157 domain-containing protein [Bacteroidia bacterium]|nr:DUF4157 domain-containing protein [Bacteroidia bacterium]